MNTFVRKLITSEQKSGNPDIRKTFIHELLENGTCFTWLKFSPTFPPWGITYSDEVLHIPMRYYIFRRGITYSDEVLHIPTRYYIFRWGITYSDEVLHIPMRYYIFRWGITYSDEVLHIPMRYYIFRWGITYSDEVLHIPTRYYIFYHIKNYEINGLLNLKT